MKNLFLILTLLFTLEAYGYNQKEYYNLKKYHNRKEYGNWQRDKDTGCNTRQVILMTQYKEFKAKVGKCKIDGVWVDFFTGKELYDLKKIDIDHVLSVSEYEAKCRRGRDVAEIRKFYNDKDNLVVTDKKVNQRKSDKSKDEYAPMIKDLQRRETYIKKYDLIWNRYCK